MKIVNACGLLFFSGLLLIAYTAGVSGNWTKTVSQQNDDAAKKVERKFRQYKRVHQDLLKKIVAGKEEDALAELDLILKVVPKDGESHYMKAVCYARMNQPELAVKHVRAALELGLESSRFRGGTKTGLESLRGVPAFEPSLSKSRVASCMDRWLVRIPATDCRFGYGRLPNAKLECVAGRKESHEL